MKSSLPKLKPLEHIEFEMSERFAVVRFNTANDNASPNYTFFSLNLYQQSLVTQFIPDTRLFGGPNEQYLLQRKSQNGLFSFSHMTCLNVTDEVLTNMIIFCHSLYN